jgi:hypothetical protein
MSSDIVNLYGLLVSWIDMVDLGMPDDDPQFGINIVNEKYSALELKVFGSTNEIVHNPTAMAYQNTRNAIQGSQRGENRDLRVDRAFRILSNISIPIGYNPTKNYILPSD